MSEPTTGIPNADKPGWWIVPPWPVPASLHEVASHFLRFLPRDDASVTEKLAYYQGYLTAIEAAPTQELKDRCDWRWYEDVRDCIGRCVSLYQDKHAADIQRANRSVRSLPPALRTTPAAPTPQEQAF
ncbi:MAG: hypothetical protein JO272_11960 [Pseudonocardiales bacterium]|nr:hypothetical protein [Pseudonocardiales bacterium]